MFALASGKGLCVCSGMCYSLENRMEICCKRDHANQTLLQSTQCKQRPLRMAKMSTAASCGIAEDPSAIFPPLLSQLCGLTSDARCPVCSMQDKEWASIITLRMLVHGPCRHVSHGSKVKPLQVGITQYSEDSIMLELSPWVQG